MATLSHFSNSYFAHGMLFLSFLASLSPLAFSRHMYIFVGPVTHYSCHLGLMGFFAIYSVNFLWSSSLGSSVCWASTNGPQHLAPWTYETFLRFICEWKGDSTILLSSFFFSFFAGLFFLKLWTLSYSYIDPPSCCEQGCLFEFPSLAVIFKTEPPLH